MSYQAHVHTAVDGGGVFKMAIEACPMVAPGERTHADTWSVANGSASVPSMTVCHPIPIVPR